MTLSHLSADALRRALALRDLTDPAQGPHAMQRLVTAARLALREAWSCDERLVREPPLVTVADNYDALGYPPEGAARDARYTRYVRDDLLLRTQTSAVIPRQLRSLPREGPLHVLLVCPGLVYRRDAIDRLHTGEPHQLDLWRIRRGRPALGVADLEAMLEVVLTAVLPGRSWRSLPAVHPYTTAGLQVDVQVGSEWVEIGECGLVHARLLRANGCGTRTSGLALGLGLDRLLMLRKGIEDIRLLRCDDRRVQEQMVDLEPYRLVSRQPAQRRDLSLAVSAGATEEELGDRVRTALGDDAVCVEEVAIADRVSGRGLPAPAVARLGLRPGQENLLLRVVLRDPVRTLTRDEANALRDRIYAALHEGTRHEWARQEPGGAASEGHERSEAR